MNQSRQNLINDLVADLRPIENAGRIGRTALVWLAVAVAYSVAIMLATGPLRPDAIADLLGYPFYALETLVAGATIAAFGVATLSLAIPGRGGPGKALALPLVLLGLWLAFYLVGLWAPAHPASMLGKREHCFVQGILFSLPNLFVMLLAARRLYPTSPRLTGLAAGIAAGAIPAALMQFGCMYDPAHILIHHFGPVALIATAAVIAAPFALRTRRTVPRSRDTSVH